MEDAKESISLENIVGTSFSMSSNQDGKSMSDNLPPFDVVFNRFFSIPEQAELKRLHASGSNSKRYWSLKDKERFAYHKAEELEFEE
jgi:hypothetical protein